ncbi:MAG: S-layer protein, partial [Candidatus Nanosalina sp.]
FGGLNPDASSAESESVGQIEFGTDGDQTATVSFSNGDDNPSIGFAYGEDSQGTDGDSNLNAQKELALADSEGYPIHVKEGAAVQEDGYFMSDAGDFEHMWKVTGIDADSQNPSSGNEATVDLEDQVTGATVEVNLDADGDGNGATANDRYEGTEVIDGQTYHFSLNVGNDGNAATDAVSVTYGNNADFGNPGEYTDVYSSLETETGSEVAFVEEVTVGENAKIVLPSTDGTGRKTVDLSTVGNGNGNAGTLITEVQAGQTVYQVREANNGEVEISLAADQADGDDDGGNEVTEPSALVVQPENDNDEEDAYVVTPQVDAQDNEVDAGDSAIIQYTDGYSTTTLDSNDNVDVGYNMFGTYTRENTDGQGSFTLNIPDGQATAGAAFTGQKGSLSSSGSSAGKVESMQPTGWNSQYVALDSDNSISQAKQNRDLVLVGGPSVNSLVSELVQANKTMAASEYTQGQGMLQLVEDAFTQGNDALVVAGYSGEDTRQAGQFLLNYEQNSNALSGKDKVTINTAQGTVVQ